MEFIKKNKKVIGICAVVLVAILLFFAIGYGKSEPEVTRGEFPVSITYEFQGETVTIKDTIVCEFDRGQKYLFDETRYWTESNKEGPGNSYLIWQDGNSHLTIHTNLEGLYLMGDPLFEKKLKESEEDGTIFHVPSGYFWDDEQGLEICDEESLAARGFKLISYEYPEPIENRFRYVGFELNNEGSFFLTMVSLVAFVIILFVVKKEKTRTYSALDKVSKGLNIVQFFFPLPLIFMMATLWGIDGTGGNKVASVFFLLAPAITLLGIACSVALRRKGYAKHALWVQFIGAAWFVTGLILDTVMLAL